MTRPRFRTLGFSTAVAVACCSLFLISAGADEPSPVPESAASRQTTLAELAMPVALDLGSYETLKYRRQVTLSDFLFEDGTPVVLELEQFDLFAPDAVIVAGTGTGDVPIGRPRIALFRGQVVGDPDSRVFLSVSPYGVNGTIALGEATHVISSGPIGAGFATVVYNLTTLPVGVIDWRPFVCGNDQLEVLSLPIATKADGAGDGDGGAPARSGPCRVAQIAIESDWEFTDDLFGGDTDASSAYATSLIGAVSEIYTRDVNTRFEISYLRVWSDSNDPWDGVDTIDQLYQFQDYWNANMTGVQRNVAHYLSGRPLGGGVAYFPGLCYPEYDYGLSASLAGYFPYPIQHNHSQNWDLMVVAHELGHNFGGPHTHDQSPPIDGCAYGDCSIVPNATLMSYCHLCDGGLANIRMEFHSQTINQYILPHLADPNTVALCDLTVDPVSISDPPDDATACVQGSVAFSVWASGYGLLSYQWRKDGGDIPGADQSSYTIADVDFGDAGDYDVVVSNTCGSVTSAAAALTVCPSITGDLDHDCDVDLEDLGALLPNYGTTSGATYEEGDVDGDGDVDLSDLAELLAYYDTSGC